MVWDEKITYYCYLLDHLLSVQEETCISKTVLDCGKKIKESHKIVLSVLSLSMHISKWQFLKIGTGPHALLKKSKKKVFKNWHLQVFGIANYYVTWMAAHTSILILNVKPVI